VHPVEVIGKTTVFYSLGNFVFGTPGRFTPAMPGYGLVVTTRFAEDGVKAIGLTCIRTDNEVVHFQPRPASADEAATVFASLGVPLQVNGANATLIVDDQAAEE
jgi:poly-gamma-glutamate capsule biosynthesis protein CapA/YwtB (metallophosphatase superfamily)